MGACWPCVSGSGLALLDCDWSLFLLWLPCDRVVDGEIALLTGHPCGDFRVGGGAMLIMTALGGEYAASSPDDSCEQSEMFSG